MTEESKNKPPAKDRYYEDYDEGEVFDCGEILISEEEIITFAKCFDPQSFHTDPAAAEQSIYGSIIASGWHTGALLMRSMVDHFVSNASQGSPGVENMRWPLPVRGGDVLRASVIILSTRRSRSKPDRGILVSRAEVHNQRRELVMDLTATNFIACRDKS